MGLVKSETMEGHFPSTDTFASSRHPKEEWWHMMAHHACGILGSCFDPITKPNCVILGGTEHRKCLKPPAKYVSTTGHPLITLQLLPLSPPPHPVRTCRLVVSTPRPGSPWFINGGTQLSSTINTQQTTLFLRWHASTGGQNPLPLVLQCFKQPEKVL